MAFVRVEQLYPLPKKQMDAVVEKYKNAKNIFGHKKSLKIWVHGHI